jgi:hypothetical protein
MPPYTDHMGMVITTESAGAAACYAEGVQLLIRSSPDAVVLLRAAVEADASLGVALAALALSSSGGAGHDEDVLGALERSLAGSSSATRRERQHMEIIAIALGGDRERAQALGCEHLREFPDDVLVDHLVARPRNSG